MMRDYEELLTKVLRIVGEERRSEIEEEVERRISEDPRLTRLGALYMVAGELGLFGESSRGPPLVPLGKLVGGLGSVNIEARVMGLSVLSGRQATSLRLGDSSGKVFATAWGRASEMLTKLRVRVGSTLQVMNAYTREKPDGSVELHMGEHAEIGEGGQGLPPLESLFSDMDAVIGAGGPLDFRAYLLGYTDKRLARVGGEESIVREILLGWDGVMVEMDLWREQAESINALTIGAELLVAGARWSRDKFTSSSRTSLNFREGAGRIVFPPISISRQLSSEEALGLCGGWVVRVASKGLRPGGTYHVDAFHFEKRGRAWVMVPDEYREAEDVVERPRLRRIGWLAAGMLEVSVEGELASKSPITRIATRRGEAELLSFWLKDETGAIFCKAWGRAAAELDRHAEGERIAILFAQVSRNPWGEKELSVSESSYILPPVEIP